MRKPDPSAIDVALSVDFTRRRVVAGVAAATGAVWLPGCGNSPSVTGGPLPTALPAPEKSGIDKVVVVMMENRSFDHYLGWVPGADGVQAGTTLKDSAGTAHHSFNLAPQFQNFEQADPDHSYAGGRTQINDGKMDGFLLTQQAGDTFPIGYYTADDLPFFKGCADHWTICDRYFSGILASTTPNRIYMHAGQTDRASNSVTVSTLPTIWDRMQGAGRSVAYYYTDVPYTSFWGSKYNSFSKKYDMASFAADIASGQLADLTYLDNVGNTFNEGTGVSMDDHPFGDVRNGQAFLNAVYNALRTGPHWERTLIVINYDEWGGFYDHVVPPFAPITPEEAAATGNDGRLGCRVPCVLIGPRVRRGHVEHTQFDPNSILNFLAWRFGFAPLGARSNSQSIAVALDFANPPNADAPTFNVPAGPFGKQCIPANDAKELGLPLPQGLPVLCQPTGVGIVAPPVPGLDVPNPTVASAEQRQLDHHAELDTIRTLANQHGFA